MIRRPPRSTLDRSSAASDVYKRQEKYGLVNFAAAFAMYFSIITDYGFNLSATQEISVNRKNSELISQIFSAVTVSYTHLRAHETVLDIVCRLLLEKKKDTIITIHCLLYREHIKIYKRFY